MSVDRYFKNILEIGANGQKKLTKATILVVGAGGLGSAVIQYLAAAGIGKIDIVDHDCLEVSNLQRQTIYCPSDIGKPKVVLAQKWLKNFNPEINVQIFQNTFQEIKFKTTNYQVLLDCTDNYSSRLAINDFCLQYGLPCVHAAVEQWQGQLFTWLPGTACYRCLFGDPPAKVQNPAGVLGTVVGVIACLQATEALKIILNKGELLTNSLLTYNALKTRFYKINFSKNCCKCVGEDNV